MPVWKSFYHQSTYTTFCEHFSITCDCWFSLKLFCAVKLGTITVMTGVLRGKIYLKEMRNISHKLHSGYAGTQPEIEGGTVEFTSDLITAAITC